MHLIHEKTGCRKDSYVRNIEHERSFTLLNASSCTKVEYNKILEKKAM